MKIAKVERGDGWRVRQNRSDHSINRISYLKPISRVPVRSGGRGGYRQRPVKPRHSLVYIVSYLSYQSVVHRPWWICNLTDRRLKTAEFGSLRKTMRKQTLGKNQNQSLHHGVAICSKRAASLPTCLPLFSLLGLVPDLSRPLAEGCRRQE